MKKAIQQNHNVYDFQAEELIGDLDNYKDTTHYKPEINDWMIRCFYNNNNLVNNREFYLLIDEDKDNVKLLLAKLWDIEIYGAYNFEK